MIDLTACPECGEPAEVTDRTFLASTDGPIEHARVRCVRDHGFFMPVEFLPVLPAPTRRDPAVERRSKARLNPASERRFRAVADFPGDRGDRRHTRPWARSAD